MLPPIDWLSLTQDELDALEDTLNTEKHRRWSWRLAGVAPDGSMSSFVLHHWPPFFHRPTGPKT
jgi:hypothetical protein